MPYRLDISSPPENALDVLVELGALDIEATADGLAAILPDSVAPDSLARRFDGARVVVSEAVARDEGSVWLLSPRDVRAAGVVLRLTDSAAFGTGHHPTTALCIEALEEIVSADRPAAILDVGTGSGILALAALALGVPHAVGVDIDAGALKAAAANARLNDMDHRLRLLLGGPGDVDGTWPLVVANVLAAPLIEMAPALIRRLAKNGRLVLSGISVSLADEVAQAYRHAGIRHIEPRTRAGWTALIAQAPW